MKYHFPDYYSEFTCIGSACPDTCCAGWNIEIDPASLAHYQKLLHSTNCEAQFAGQLKNSVDFRRGTFRLRGRRCALLNEQNLCDLYIHAGKDSLCRTCRTYPRHQEEFGSVREISLSMSCPEAARIILNQKGRPAMITKRTAAHCPKDQEVDPIRLTWLLKARDMLLDILWKPVPLSLAVSMVLAFSHDLQHRYDSPGYFSELSPALAGLNKLAGQYLAPDSDRRFIRQRDKHLHAQRHDSHRDQPAKEHRNYEKLLRSLLSLYAPLVPLVESWPVWIDQCRYTPPRLAHAQDLAARQLVTYYLQVYFPGAIYDDDLRGKTVFAALSWLMTSRLAQIFQNSGSQNSGRMDPFIQAAYLYSRQIENHDENLEQILYAGSRPEFKLFPLLHDLS